MEMVDWLFYTYFTLFAIGFGYALFLAITSGVVSGDIEFDGADFDGADFDGDFNADMSGEVHFSPFSPMVIAAGMTGFGGAGLICSKVPLLRSPAISVIIAIAASFLMGFITYKMLSKIFSFSQGSSQPNIHDIIGSKAEVIIPIPENGVGKMQFTCRGTIFTGTARSEKHVAIANHAEVTIERIVGNTYYVSLSVDQELRDLDKKDPTAKDK